MMQHALGRLTNAHLRLPIPSASTTTFATDQHVAQSAANMAVRSAPQKHQQVRLQNLKACHRGICCESSFVLQSDTWCLKDMRVLIICGIYPNRCSGFIRSRMVHSEITGSPQARNAATQAKKSKGENKQKRETTTDKLMSSVCIKHAGTLCLVLGLSRVFPHHFWSPVVFRENLISPAFLF